MPNVFHRSEAIRRGATALSWALLSIFALGCNLGGGGGGGPPETALPPRPPYDPSPFSDDPVVRGAAVYEQVGCVLCHGAAGAGGVANLNSETAGEINGLTLVKEGYDDRELQDMIAKGVDTVGREDPDGPEPPLRMPEYGLWLPADEIADLSAYLISLFPKDRKIEDDWDD